MNKPRSNPSNGSPWSKANGDLFRFERVRHDHSNRTVPADMLEQIRAFPAAKVQQCAPASHASQFGQALSSTRNAGGHVYGRGRAQ